MLLHRASFGAASVVGTVHVMMVVVSAVSFRTWFRTRTWGNHAAGQSEQGGGSYAQAQCGFDFRQMNHISSFDGERGGERKDSRFLWEYEIENNKPLPED